MTLFILIAAIFYYYVTPQRGMVSIDAVKLKMSSIQKPKSTIRKAQTPTFEKMEVTDFETETVSDSAVSFVSDEEQDDVDDDRAETEHTDPGAGDPSAAWHAELKDLLVRLEPEDGETLFNAYMSERENFQAELDALFQEKNKGGRGVAGEFDGIISQLEKKHEEKLKELLGGHYEEVSQRQADFHAVIQGQTEENSAFDATL